DSLLRIRADHRVVIARFLVALVAAAVHPPSGPAQANFAWWIAPSGRSGPKAYFTLEHGGTTRRSDTLFGLAQQPPDVRAQQIDLRRLVLLATEAADVLRLP